MGRIRAWFRIIALVVVLAYFISGLLLRTWMFGQDRERGLRYRRKYINNALRILGVSLEVRGTQADIPALYVSNHRSLLDPFINLLFIDAVIVSKAEVARYPLVGVGARLTGVIFVHRDKGSSRAAAKEAIRRALRDGLSVLIYPEGTTSNVDTTQEFKPGSFAVAAEENIPVVPVAVEYRDPEHKWHDGDLMPFFVRKFSSRKIMAYTAIGQPLRSSDPQYLLDSARTWIWDQLEQIQNTWES